MRKEVIKKIKLDFVFSSYMYIRVDHLMHKVEFEFSGGKAPNVHLFVDFLLKDKDVRKELKWAETHQGKTYFKIHEGQSGCRTIRIYESDAQHEWAQQLTAREKIVFHISSVESLSSGIPDFKSYELYVLLKILEKKYGMEKLKWNNFSYMKYKRKRIEPIEYL